MDDQRKADFVRLVRETVEGTQPEPPNAAARHAIHVTGNGNTAVISSGAVHIHHRPKVVANVRPDDIHISHEQAARLKILVLAAVRATGQSHQAVWTALHHHMLVPQYRLIPAAAFADAVALLERWATTRRLTT